MYTLWRFRVVTPHVMVTPPYPSMVRLVVSALPAMVVMSLDRCTPLLPSASSCCTTQFKLSSLAFWVRMECSSLYLARKPSKTLFESRMAAPPQLSSTRVGERSHTHQPDTNTNSHVHSVTPHSRQATVDQVTGAHSHIRMPPSVDIYCEFDDDRYTRANRHGRACKQDSGAHLPKQILHNPRRHSNNNHAERTDETTCRHTDVHACSPKQRVLQLHGSLVAEVQVRRDVLCGHYHREGAWPGRQQVLRQINGDQSRGAAHAAQVERSDVRPHAKPVNKVRQLRQVKRHHLGLATAEYGHGRPSIDNSGHVLVNDHGTQRRRGRVQAAVDAAQGQRNDTVTSVKTEATREVRSTSDGYVHGHPCDPLTQNRSH